jgi:hypothetical protein
MNHEFVIHNPTSTASAQTTIVRDQRGRAWVIWPSGMGHQWPMNGGPVDVVWFDELTDNERMREGWSPPWRTIALIEAVHELYARNQELERKLGEGEPST